MKLNIAPSRVPIARTHEGVIASRVSPLQELRRTVAACLLWEDGFYESGESVADRIKALVAVTPAESVVALAIEARNAFKLRHVPLLLARELVRHGYNVAALLPQIIQRPDELAEFLAIYWKDREGQAKKIPSSVKRGLSAAFVKFNAYSLAKYNRDGAIKLRDVLFLIHAKPKDSEQAETWKQLVANTLPVPDTWEVALSAGNDPLETWTRLLAENKLGALALLRNLRNMQQAKVPEAIIRESLASMATERALPFRFISAAKYAPQLEDALEPAMFRALGDMPKFHGKTALVIDGSGSMFGPSVSSNSDLQRFDAACALAMLAREVCESVAVTVFSSSVRSVPPRRGFALRDALTRIAERQSTDTGAAVAAANRAGYDRIIVLTDEQSHTAIPAPLPGTHAYVVNVANYKNGIGYGAWTHIDGWSEAVLEFVRANEALADTAA